MYSGKAYQFTRSSPRPAKEYYQEAQALIRAFVPDQSQTVTDESKTPFLCRVPAQKQRSLEWFL